MAAPPASRARVEPRTIGSRPGASYASHSTDIAPSNVALEFDPVKMRMLQSHAHQRWHFAGRIFEHFRQGLAQHFRALCNDYAELGEQSPNSTDAGRALLFVALAQPVHGEQESTGAQ